MPDTSLVIPERTRDIGGFKVGRVLPFRKKRQIGPFTFIDHMGPIQLSYNDQMDVDQHPHIGICTLTYLFEGGIEHRDSTGAIQIVKPGDVGLMTAGKGITHTERTPENFRDLDNYDMHGYQIWIALPKELEEMEPRFDYVENKNHPKWLENDLELKLLAGKAFNKTSPLPVHSELFLLEVKSYTENILDLSRGNMEGEIGVLVVTGSIQIDSNIIEAGNLHYSESIDKSIVVHANSLLLLLGGKKFPEERYLFWNFVSSSKERLEEAKNDWINKRFPEVPGDNTYVPLPKI